MPEKRLNATDIIFSEGDIADFAYTVTSGSVGLFRVHNGVEINIAILDAGVVFGELAIFAPQELREYTARAIGEAVVQGMTQEDFRVLFEQCPPTIQPYLIRAFEKFIPPKTKTKPQPVSLPKSDVEKITLSPAGDALKTQIKEIEIPSDSLPFRIGGYPEGSEKNRRDQLHLAIASQTNPLLVSRQHCEITSDQAGNIVINDLGSRFGTVVNGVAIGRGRGIYMAPLKKGDNALVLGAADSKYQLAIICGGAGVVAEATEKPAKTKKPPAEKHSGF